MGILKKVVIIFVLLYILYRLPLTGTPPKDMVEKAKEIDRISKDKLELTRNIYDYTNQSYTSPIRQYLREPGKVFEKNIENVWNNKGEYYPSHIQNELFKKMLISTGKFKEEDFIYKQGFCQISPHEYYELKIDNQTYFIDLWGADWDIPFGCYAPIPCTRGVAICP